MPSQEEYLDNLLKGISTQESDETARTLDIESTKDMTEEEIEKLLAVSQSDEINQGVSQSKEQGNNEDDLIELLNAVDNKELHEIQELLQKADNNEAVDDEIVALLQEPPEEIIDPLAEIEGESHSQGENSADKRKQQAEIRRQKQAERKAEKEAKKQLQQAAKAEKKAQKEAMKAQKAAAKAEKVAPDTTEDMELSGISENTNASEIESVAETIPEVGAVPEIDAIPEAETMQEDSFEEFAEEEPAQEEAIEDEKEDTLAEFMPDAADLSDIEELLNLAGQTENPKKEKSTEKVIKESPEEQPSLQDTSPVTDIGEVLQEGEVPTKEKKKIKGLFSKIANLLTETNEEENEGDEIQLSDENKTILQDMDNEKKNKKRGKKEKGKKEKGKKGQEQEASENSENEEDASKEKKPEKEKKEKKPKKEKAPKPVELEKEKSKLSLKKILPVALVCLTLGVVLILVANLAGGYSAKQEAVSAFYSGDYQTCYQNLYGKDLTESQQVMLGKSESILRIRLWIREYEVLAEEGSEAEALDSLVQSVNEYPTLYSYSSQWNASTEVADSYAQILSILSEKYHLTEAQTLEIASTENDADYSKKIYMLAEGQPYGSWEQSGENSQPEILEDVLPEEEDIEEDAFVDNGGRNIGNADNASVHTEGDSQMTFDLPEGFAESPE